MNFKMSMAIFSYFVIFSAFCVKILHTNCEHLLSAFCGYVFYTNCITYFVRILHFFFSMGNLKQPSIYQFIIKNVSQS